MSFLTFGVLVKERREELGLTRLELATRVGVSEQTIYKIEVGRISDMRASNLFNLSESLRWTPEQVYKAFRGRGALPTNEEAKIKALKQAYKEFLLRVKAIESGL